MSKQLLKILEKVKGKKILVWGDLVCDEYIYGDVSRISREAPVLVLKKTGSEYLLGGAANAANNLISLGAKVKLMGILGKDENGKKLLSLFKNQKIDTTGISIEENFSTITKTRIMAGGINRTKQQVIRIDEEVEIKSQSDKIRDKFWEYFLSIKDSLDGVLISDYSYGAVNYKTYNNIVKTLAKKNIPIIVDSRFDLLKFKNATVLTPNEEEAAEALGMAPEDIGKIAKKILNELNPKILILTRGKKGMDVFMKNKTPRHIPIYGTNDVIDVTGAGDTVSSIVTLALSCKADGYDAAQLANYAASIVVMKMGASTVSTKELKEALSR
ncbi:MAG: bifunctional hydroxymethylpyrimidine kinase/phosphomethylpyrimidine kinase [Candidatus Omnitrophica bacterium]|nr:bifunctional hydroxymethylpyrimidine kinase/phosphomethylpyrimidine kinase [Candidatus Omnitrophota bacterium]MBU1048243.1 bifunctional hydroxymethylpyrimidine kinase/phosphomethylpyrimidine kinase [Candidatus Omnitrophota bacterium]MBU1630793.1 bifunctional hydroxymethylpyrimidine kinase/phosphomethylpyrimidine kinase [Candidatus Omnitrophota bacterium]MBU1767830.1 bifunctional hydroxymethylpyrimidine kinase/phosphomethylpyrimidine kinase [Candidatus Omnitrophota bacterium]MBU1889263.1 bifu